MLRIIYKSKIHNAKVTEANVNYTGSITIPSEIIKAADIFPGEKVQVVNLNNASRIETYVIEGEAKSGNICMNGGAALCAKIGDRLIIISYGLINSKEVSTFSPKIVHLDDKNQVKKA